MTDLFDFAQPSITERPFFSELQTASWRGVPFAVTGSTAKVGRRNAIHEYPFRDQIWVEDLGRQGRRITLSGFLLENGAYGGGSVISQRAAMIAACETEQGDPNTPDGELVHPSLGRMTVSLLDFECVEQMERGRYFELHFVFVESGSPLFPSTDPDTAAQTMMASQNANSAMTGSFINAMNSIRLGGPVLESVIGIVTGFISSVTALAGRATSLIAMTSSLQGNYGRFVGENSPSQPVANPPTLQSLVGTGAQARQTVETAGDSLSDAVAVADWNGASAATQTLTGALLSANPDPCQAVQSMLNLQQSVSAPQSAIPVINAANTAIVNMLQRSAVIGLAQASASYQPTSVDDAQALRAKVCDALDTEIDVAGDAQEDDMYMTLRALRVAVAQDMKQRGSTQAQLRAVSMTASLPMLVISQRLYYSITQYNELLKSAQPINPVFGPTNFKAPVL